MKKIAAIVTDESVVVKGIKSLHNEIPWTLKTNRHRELDGKSWGWIDGTPGNVCWSNSGSFDFETAFEMVRAHNEWLSDQKSPAIKAIEIRRSLKEFHDKLDKLFKERQETELKIEGLQKELSSLILKHPELYQDTRGIKK